MEMKLYHIHVFQWLKDSERELDLDIAPRKRQLSTAWNMDTCKSLWTGGHRQFNDPKIGEGSSTHQLGRKCSDTL